MVELIAARDYYGRHATGTVVLVNGFPSHFVGRSARKDALAFMESDALAAMPATCATHSGL